MFEQKVSEWQAAERDYQIAVCKANGAHAAAEQAIVTWQIELDAATALGKIAGAKFVALQEMAIPIDEIKTLIRSEPRIHAKVNP